MFASVHTCEHTGTNLPLRPSTTHAALDSADLPSGTMDRFSLMGLARVVMARALVVPAGILPQMGFVDLNLMGFARCRRIPVHGLELPQVQTAAMFSKPNGLDAGMRLQLAPG